MIFVVLSVVAFNELVIRTQACEDEVSFMYKMGTMMQCAVHVKRSPVRMCEQMTLLNQQIHSICPVSCGKCPPTTARPTSDPYRIERIDMEALF